MGRHSTITIEKTSKRFKLSKVIGGVVALFGLALLKDQPGPGAALLCFGILTIFYAKIGAWCGQTNK
jgi:hypothetical protein